MKYAALLALLLTACAQDIPPPQTITVTKTVPVYPPDELYGINSGCQHAAARTDGTVRDLANALIDERTAVDVCLGDRAALRDWKAAVSK